MVTRQHRTFTARILRDGTHPKIRPLTMQYMYLTMINPFFLESPKVVIILVTTDREKTYHSGDNQSVGPSVQVVSRWL